MKPSFENKALSNYDLLDWIKYLNIKNFNGIFSRDNVIFKKGYTLINVDHSENSGTHWIAIFIQKDKIEYFDSFGLPPFQRLVDYVNSSNMKYTYNSTQYQAKLSVLCGYYCLYYINKQTKKSYYDVLKPLSHTDVNFNEKFITSYLM